MSSIREIIPDDIRVRYIPDDIGVRYINNSKKEWKGVVLVVNYEKGSAKVLWDYGGTSEYTPLDKLEVISSHKNIQGVTPYLEVTDEDDLELPSKEIEDSVNSKFYTIKELTRGVANKKLNGLLVHGEGGIGKTFTIVESLEESLKDNEKRFFKRIAGHITPLQLYNTLESFNSPDTVILFDDCDSVFKDPTSLNVLKAAMDTTPKRVVQWKSSSVEVVTDQFEFVGNIIVITNTTISNNSNTKAFFDRIHNFRLSLTNKERILRISQISKAIANESEISDEVREKCVEWLFRNVKDASTLTLRTFVKLCNLAGFSENWESLAKMTILQQSL